MSDQPEKSEPKIIQLVVLQRSNVLIALMDDGTMWKQPSVVGDQGKWNQIEGPKRRNAGGRR